MRAIIDLAAGANWSMAATPDRFLTYKIDKDYAE
jgi:hypothetical protein